MGGRVGLVASEAQNLLALLGTKPRLLYRPARRHSSWDLCAAVRINVTLNTLKWLIIC